MYILFLYNKISNDLFCRKMKKYSFLLLYNNIRHLVLMRFVNINLLIFYLFKKCFAKS